MAIFPWRTREMEKTSLLRNGINHPQRETQALCRGGTLPGIQKAFQSL